MATFEERVKAHQAEMKKSKGIPWTGSLSAVTHINGKRKEVAKKMKKSTNHLFDADSILAHDRNYRKTHPDYKSKTQ